MERTYWIDHKGKQILYSDYSNLEADEIIETVRIVEIEVFPKLKNTPKGTLLSLIDFEGSVASKPAVQALKEAEQMWLPLCKKQAVIGLSAFHHLFLVAINNAVGSHLVPFKSKEKALDWLVEE